MRKSNHVLGTREMLKIRGVRRGIGAFFGMTLFAVVLMWMIGLSLVGAGVLLAVGAVLFSFLARKDVMELRKLNKEAGKRRI